MLLDNKIALVTGGGKGIGRGIALGLADAGCHVVVVDLDAASAEEAAQAVVARKRRAAAMCADVGDLSDIDRIVGETVAAFGRLDILVNNAAVTRRAQIMDVTEQDWDRIQRVNAKGVFFCLQRAAREMIARRSGRIINIASISGKGHPGTSSAAYSASKGAVLSLTKTAAQQLADYDITVNAVCPGTTRSTMFQDNLRLRAQREGVPEAEIERRRAAAIPLRRFNDPEDIAAMTVFLASPGARNITGQSFNVDGGLVMS